MFRHMPVILVAPRVAGEANICSCPARRRSCTPTSTRSTRRSSSATIRALRGRPVIVGGGVVLAASYEAKALGVRTAMGGRQARRLCPDAIVVPPRMSAYSEASKAVFEVFEHTTPLVEGISIDEAFLDVGGLRRVSGTPTEIAARLRRDVLERVGLPITVGVARTKFLAKVASGVAKPDGLLVVPPDRELAFLHPLPVERLWGVGPVTAEKLHDRGITTVGEVAAPAGGRAGVDARAGHRAAICTRSRTTAIRGRCRSAGGAARSARSARWAARRRSPEALDAVVVAARRPGHPPDARRRPRRPHGRAAPALRRLLAATRSHTLRARHRRTPQTILATARATARRRDADDRAPGLTLIGVSVGNLDDGDVVQLALPFDRTAGARSTPRSTACATGSVRRRSPGRCSLGRTRAGRSRCFPIEDR